MKTSSARSGVIFVTLLAVAPAMSGCSLLFMRAPDTSPNTVASTCDDDSDLPWLDAASAVATLPVLLFAIGLDTSCDNGNDENCDRIAAGILAASTVALILSATHGYRLLDECQKVNAGSTTITPDAAETPTQPEDAPSRPGAPESPAPPPAVDNPDSDPANEASGSTP